MDRHTPVVAALVGVILVVAPTSVLAVEPAISLSVSPGRLEFLAGAGDAPIVKTLTVVVGGDAAGRVTVSLSDVVPTDTGMWTAAPPGTTPYSLSDRTTIEPATIDYTPGDHKQTFTTTVTVRASAADPPRAGSVVVTFTPTTPGPSGGVSVRQGVSIDTAAVSAPAPDALATLPVVTASLAAEGIDVMPARTWTPVDAVVPDLLPAIVDHGPVSVTARFRNTGDVILDTRTTYTYASVSPLAMLPGSTEQGTGIYRFEDRPRYSLPGQTTVAQASSEVPLDGGGSVDSLPFIGFVRITATTTAALGALSADPVAQTAVIFVFPWKELAGLLLLVGLLALIRVAWARRRARAAPGDGPA